MLAEWICAHDDLCEYGVESGGYGVLGKSDELPTTAMLTLLLLLLLLDVVAPPACHCHSTRCLSLCIF